MAESRSSPGNLHPQSSLVPVTNRPLPLYTHPTFSRPIRYYEKWTLCAIAMLLERGVITAAEVDAAIGPSWDDNPTVQLAVGDVVTVRPEDTATRFRKVCLKLWAVCVRALHRCLGARAGASVPM